MNLTRGQRVRQRGPEPTLTDADNLTIEVAGDPLRPGQDTAIDRAVRHPSGA